MGDRGRLEAAREVLGTYFGYGSFRAGQEAVVSSVLAGRDVLAVMPTGAGKSVCYQVPAVVLDGLTLVISPLVSLMADQVRSLKEAGVRGAYLNSRVVRLSRARCCAGRVRGPTTSCTRRPSGWTTRAF